MTREVVDFIHNLPETLLHPEPQALQVPFSTQSTNYYLRIREELLNKPTPKWFVKMCDIFREGDQIKIRKAVDEVITTFNKCWNNKLLMPDVLLVDINEPLSTIVEGNLTKKRYKNTQLIWDRIVTPRFTIDTAELHPIQLAILLSGPRLLARQYKLMEQRAIDNWNMSNGDSPYQLKQVMTSPRVNFTCDAYMIEVFTWMHAAGRIEPIDAST